MPATVGPSDDRRVYLIILNGLIVAILLNRGVHTISTLMIVGRNEMERELVRRIQPLSRRLRAAADTAVASLDVSDATGWALLQVHRSGSEASQAKLAAALEISAPSLVRLLGQLERRGFIRREADGADRRPNRVMLTPEGRSAAEQIEERLAPVRASLFRGFSDGELLIANKLLAGIDERLQTEVEGGPRS
jgi:MarR family transcriptional regulator for hemolysin